MSDLNKVVLDLIQALIEEWGILYTVEEVACDEGKVALLLNATQARGTVPDNVRNFYKKVFLRDIWYPNG